MDIEFYKYQGAGNDFILVDNRENIFPDANRIEIVQKLCKRHIGIGSDGLILIQTDVQHDFYMEFYNPDGSQSFCGNGSRCAVMFAFHFGMIGNKCSFNSIHGINEGRIVDSKNVALNMFDVNEVEIGEDYHFLNTGSPHYNLFVEDVSKIDLIPFARNIRYNNRFKELGTNVNVIEQVDDSTIKVRTYERGVENETLSCGTGVTACAISQLILEKKKGGKITIMTNGGTLSVEIGNLADDSVDGIVLTGPAEFVFKGEIDV